MLFCAQKQTAISAVQSHRIAGIGTEGLQIALQQPIQRFWKSIPVSSPAIILLPKRTCAARY